MPRLCVPTRCPSLTRPLLVLALVFIACAPYWLYAHPPERTPDGITGEPRRWFGGGKGVGRWDVPPANPDAPLSVVSEIAGGPPPPGPGPLDTKHPELAPPQEDRRPEEILAKPDAKEVAQVEVEPITFALIMWSEDAASEGAILIKSILMYTSTPVHIHILADHTAQAYLTRRLALVKHPRHHVRVTFYALTMDAMLARIEREGTMTSDHVAGVPGLMKLFLHELLPPSVKRAIFVDTDAFFLSDPLLLWHQFSMFNATTGVAMPSHPEMFAPQWFDANKICSCVMLLDLERLREAHLMHSSARVSQSPLSPDAPPGEGQSLSRPAFAALFGSVDPVTGKYAHIALGDQTFWWALISHAPYLYKHLPYDWEVSACMLDMYGAGLASLDTGNGDGSEGGDDSGEQDELARMVHTWDTPHQGQVILPKLVHFNCLEGPRYHTWAGWSNQQNSLTRRWAPAVRYHAGYKWLWLNQASPLDRGAAEEGNGETEARVVIETVAEPHFADELAS